jgi:hypothetical protein
VIQEAIQHHSSFNVIHLATMFKVDIFILNDDSFSQTEMTRRERYQVLEESIREIFVASPEDTILRKLHWFRLGGELSERQWQDVIGVIEVKNEKLDRVYLLNGAKQVGVVDLLERAFENAGIILYRKPENTCKD